MIPPRKICFEVVVWAELQLGREEACSLDLYAVLDLIGLFLLHIE